LVCDNLNTHTAALSIGSINNSGEKKFTQINTGQNCKYLKLGGNTVFSDSFQGKRRYIRYILPRLMGFGVEYANSVRG